MAWNTYKAGLPAGVGKTVVLSHTVAEVPAHEASVKSKDSISDQARGKARLTKTLVCVFPMHRHRLN